MPEQHDITIVVDDSDAKRSVTEINAGLASTEKSAQKTGAAIGQGFTEGAQTAVRVTQQSSTTINRIVANTAKEFARISAGPQAPLERAGAVRGFAIERVAGDAQAVQRINSAYEQTVSVLKAKAEADSLASQAADRHTARMRAASEQTQRLRDGISAYNQRQAERRQTEERVAADYDKTLTSMQRLGRQMDLLGRSPLDRQLISLRQEFEGATLGVNKQSDAYKKLNSEYLAAQTRITAQTTATKSLGGELKNAIERLGAAFVAYKLFNIAVKEGILGTALYAARTETLGVALTAAARANNLSVAGIRQQETAIKKLGITTQEARESLSRMIVAQINTASATKLARLAQDAAVISNINSSDAFQQMIYGIQSGQVRVLRTIGINVQFQESYQRLAEQIHKNVLELTEEEKAEARVQEVLKVAPQYFGLYEEAMTSTGKQITSLKRYFDEAQYAIGQKFTPALGVAVRGLTAFLKLMADKPEIGSWGAILVGTAAIGIGAQFMLGTKAAMIVGALGGTVAVIKILQDLSKEFAERMQGVVSALNNVALMLRNLDLGGLPSRIVDSLKNWTEGLPERMGKAIYDAIRSGGRGAVEAVGGKSLTPNPFMGGWNWSRPLSIPYWWGRGQARYSGEQYGTREEMYGQLPHAGAERPASTALGAATYTGVPGISTWSEYWSRMMIEMQKPHPQEAVSKLERAWAERRVVSSPGGGAATPAMADFLKEVAVKQEEAFMRAWRNLDKEAAAQERLTMAAQKLKDVIDNKDMAHLRAAYEEKKIAESIVESFKRQKEIEEYLVTLHRVVTVQESEYLRKTQERVQKLTDERASAAQWAEAYPDLMRGMVEEFSSEQEKMMGPSKWIELSVEQVPLLAHKLGVLRGDIPVLEFTKLTEESDKFFSTLTDSRAKEAMSNMGIMADDISAGARMMKDQTDAGKRLVDAILQGNKQAETFQQTSAEKRMDMEKRMALRATGTDTGMRGIQTTYQIELEYADKALARENERAALITDTSEKLKVMSDAQIKYQGTLQDAEISRITNIASLEQKHFDDLKRGFESLFDAAFESARSFTSALKRLLIAAFLTPIKEGLANMFASAFSGGGFGGGGGGTARAGGLSGVFTGLASAMNMGRAVTTQTGGVVSGGLSNLFAMQPGLGTNTLANIAAGGGGTVTGGGVGGGAGQYAGMLGGLSNLGNFFWNPGSISLGAGGATTAGGIGGIGGGLAGFATSPGGLMAGGLLGYLGLRRGGLLGAGLTAGGGALTGAALGTMVFPGIGTAIGAGIGALIGGGAGLIRMLFKGAVQKAHDKIKSMYGVDIKETNILRMIVDIAKQSYGGNLDMAIRTQQVRDLVELYAASSGQTSGVPGVMRQMSMSQVSGGGLTSSTYNTGGTVSTASLVSSGVRAGVGAATSGPGTAAPVTIVVQNQLPANQVGDYMRGQIVSTVVNVPRATQAASLKATGQNFGRRQLAASMLSPGVIIPGGG